MTGGREFPDEPIARERATASEEDLHASKCQAGLKSGWFLSLSEMTVGVSRPWQLEFRIIVADTTLVLW